MFLSKVSMITASEQAIVFGYNMTRHFINDREGGVEEGHVRDQLVDCMQYSQMAEKEPRLS